MFMILVFLFVIVYLTVVVHTQTHTFYTSEKPTRKAFVL